MLKDEILEILNDYNFWKNKLATGFVRDEYIKELERLQKLDEIVVVSGIRRCGKSTLILQLCEKLIKEGIRKEDILIVNFEDPRFRELNLELLNKIYELYLTELNPSKIHYVVLDEVQAIVGWEKFARYLHETKKIKVFVTGSSSKLLSSEYSTVLAGRHVDLRIFPLSFKELLGFKNVHIKSRIDLVNKRHEIKRLFQEYLRFGGFPKVVLADSEQGKKELLDIYFRDIIVKDVIQRYGITESYKLEQLAKYYLTNTSTLQSFNKLKNIIKSSLDTVERFSYCLSSIFLLSFVKKFSYAEKEQILNPRKVYSCDLGIRNYVSFVFSQDLGRLAENLVFIELNKTKDEVFYWKDETQMEVDFIVKQGLKLKHAIQVCWDINEEKTKGREISSILEALKKLKLKEGIVITYDYEGEQIIETKKIFYIPIWKWLLGF